MRHQQLEKTYYNLKFAITDANTAIANVDVTDLVIKTIHAGIIVTKEIDERSTIDALVKAGRSKKSLSGLSVCGSV